MFNPTYREKCIICWGPLPGVPGSEQKRGRPRRTCGDACRQRLHRRDVRDRTPWTKLELERNTRSAKKQMRRWAKAGVDLNAAIPGYTGMNLGQRLYLYLQRGWPVQSCRRCRAPFILDGVATEFCGPVCSAEHRRLEKAIEAWSGDPVKAASLDPRVQLYLRTDQPLRLCAECGKPFPVLDKRRITCSDQCRLHRHRQKHKKCPNCGKVFEPRKTGGTLQKYCKPECKNEAQIKRSAQKVRRKLRKRRCLMCRELFMPTRRGHYTCSTRCARKYRTVSTAKALPDQVCAWCGERYVPKRTTQRYHTADCKRLAANARKREAKARRREDGAETLRGGTKTMHGDAKQAAV
jgi:hypothetical protein